MKGKAEFKQQICGFFLCFPISVIVPVDSHRKLVQLYSLAGWGCTLELDEGFHPSPHRGILYGVAEAAVTGVGRWVGRDVTPPTPVSHKTKTNAGAKLLMRVEEGRGAFQRARARASGATSS